MKDWKARAERSLMRAESPQVMTTAALLALATAGLAEAPSPATLARWVAGLVEAGKLREVIKGVYLNVLGHRDVSPAAAAFLVRSRSIVSLSWVLEQAGVTNNLGDTITCVIPTHPSWPNPNLAERVTRAGTYRFYAMPDQLARPAQARFDDVQDAHYTYARATPEKAFLDWVYLGSSPRSRLHAPPPDLDMSLLDERRIRRLTKAMQVEDRLGTWMQGYAEYQADEDVRENTATRLKL